MMTRRGNRESWVPEQPNRHGYWEGTVWMGRKPDGRPDRRHISRRTRAERNKAVKELERRREAGATRSGRPPTVQAMLERHTDVVLASRGRAPRTIADYKSKCRNDIFPALGGQRIDGLLPEHIEDFYASMLNAGHAPAHVRKVHAILSSALELEVRKGNLARNPCKLVEAPEVPLARKPSLTQAQARGILLTIGERRDAARWWLGLACGLRQGEVLGLRWEDADLERGVLHVWRQLQRLTWDHGCDPPCSGKRGADCPGRRLPPGCVPLAGGLVLREVKERRRKAIPVAPLVVGMLKARQVAQDGERFDAGSMWEEHGLVFASVTGRPVDPRADWEEWKAICAAAGAPHVGVHGMRHSAATIALEQGISARVVQVLLGHSNLKVTEGYMGVAASLTRDAAEQLERALSGP